MEHDSDIKLSHCEVEDWRLLFDSLSDTELNELKKKFDLLLESRTRELVEAKERLLRQEMLSSIGQFASCIRHDIRNPLGVINNSVYFLRAISGDAGEKVREHFSLIEKQVAAIDRIIGDLLDFSRDAPLSLTPASINDLISETVNSMILPETVTVIMDSPRISERIYIDYILMRRALINLINNAVYAMQGEGTLRISALVIEKWFEISVWDTGSGIADEHHEKIFEPLFTTKKGGLGLGLTIVQDVVRKHGGKVYFETTPGSGSVFRMIIPFSQY